MKNAIKIFILVLKKTIKKIEQDKNINTPLSIQYTIKNILKKKKDIG